MANEENLIPNSERTPSERRENAKKAGQASGLARRRKKEMRELCGEMLAMSLHDGKLININVFDDVRKDSNVTVNEAILLIQIRKAIAGDTRSAEFVRDTSGQKPIEKIAHAAVDADVLEEIEALVKRNDT